MQAEPIVHEFRPKLIPRRGELIAWLGSLIVGVGWVILAVFGQGVNILIPIVFILLSLIAASISLGNWMDRKTRLSLEPGGVVYHNGLRNVKLDWAEIQELRVFPAQWGRKVQVIGEKAYFGFSTLGEVKVNDRLIGQTGFADGEMILQRIIENAHLDQMQPSQAGLPENSYYYSRK
jgi:hypothetical protein